MRLVIVGESIINTYTAVDVVNSKDQVILKKNTLLQLPYIIGLTRQGIKSIYIVDEISSDVEDIGLIDIREKNKLINTYSEIAKYINPSENISTSKKIKLIKEIDAIILLLAKQISREVNPAKILEFIDASSSEYYIFEHIINVSIYVSYISKHLKYDYKKQISILKASLTYDLGMLAIDQNIINKKTALTAAEKKAIEDHTYLGYKFLDNYTSLSLLEKIPALQHHKWLNGKGYPNIDKYKDIQEFSQIIALADTFDAMTSARPYRDAISHSEAIEYILGAGDLKFDYSIVNSFINNIIVYPMGSKIRLSDNSVGYVVENYKRLPLRPQILVVKSGNILSLGYVKLIEYNTIVITKIILS